MFGNYRNGKESFFKYFITLNCAFCYKIQQCLFEQKTPTTTLLSTNFALECVRCGSCYFIVCYVLALYFIIIQEGLYFLSDSVNRPFLIRNNNVSMRLSLILIALSSTLPI